MKTTRTNEYVSLAEGALILGVSVDTLRRRISTGALPAFRSGQRLIRVRLDDLERVFQPIPSATTWQRQPARRTTRRDRSA